MTDTPEWTLVSVRQPPSDPPWAWSATTTGMYVTVRLTTEPWEEELMWAPITGHLPPPLDAVAEPERPAPLFEVGAQLWYDGEGLCVPTVAPTWSADSPFRHIGEKRGHYWLYGTNETPILWAEHNLRLATPAELYPVGSPDRIDDDGVTWRITGHRLGVILSQPVLPGVNLGHRSWTVAEWEAMELAPEPLPEPPSEHCCHACNDELDRLDPPDGPFSRSLLAMMLCRNCGNKRCPKASDHRHACTGSNEPGQVGSVYGPCDPPEPPVPAGPWRPTSETPEAGRRVVVHVEGNEPDSLGLHGWYSDSSFHGGVLGWMYASDALALIDAGYRAAPPVPPIPEGA